MNLILSPAIVFKPVLRGILLSLAVLAPARNSNSSLKVTANMPTDGSHNSKQAIYELNGRHMTITLDSAKELRQVFSAQANKQKGEFSNYPLLQPGEPRIDSKGILHLGAWSLETEGGELVLSQRARTPPEARVFYRLLAKVRRSSDGIWAVEPIVVERVFR